MSGVQESGLTELTYPVDYADHYLIGRGGTTYRSKTILPIRPIPLLLGVTDQGDAYRRCVISDDPLNWWDCANMPVYLNGTGSNWTDLLYIADYKTVFAVAALNNGGNKNVIAASRDGRDWAGRSNDITTVNTGIAYAPTLGTVGRICICRSSGVTASDRFWTSDDKGITWTNRTCPTVSITFNCIAWSPSLSLFVAMGASNAVFTSPDGITWTSRTGPTSGGSWRRVIWAGGTVNKFVAFDGNNIGVSSDGTSWGAAIGASMPGNGRGLAFSPTLNILVISDANSNNLINHSSNGGTTWTTHTVTGAWQDVVWSAKLALFIAVGVNLLATSPDGSTWTVQPSPIPNSAGFLRLHATQ